MTNLEIIKQYTDGKLTLTEANKKLKGIKLDPDKNVMTEAENRATTVGYYPDMANGWGLLDSGTGTLDKVFIRDGKLVGCNMGESFALCIIGGKTYEVKGDTLVEV